MAAAVGVETNGHGAAHAHVNGAATLARVSAFPYPELLACPACRGELRAERDGALACAACSAPYASRDGIVDLRVPSEARTETVRTFYSRSPFPNYPPNDTLSGLRGRAARSEFARLLEQAVPGDARNGLGVLRTPRNGRRTLTP